MLRQNIVHLDIDRSLCIPIRLVKEQLINLKVYDMFTSKNDYCQLTQSQLFISISNSSFETSYINKTTGNEKERFIILFFQKLCSKLELLRSVCTYNIFLLRR